MDSNQSILKLLEVKEDKDRPSTAAGKKKGANQAAAKEQGKDDKVKMGELQ